MHHLTEGELIDLADRVTAEGARPHLASCAECRRQLAELRATMSAAADAGVPEPSPLFWEHLSAEIRERVAEEHTDRSLDRWTWLWRWWRIAVPFAGLAAIAVAASMTLRAPRPITSGTPDPLVADSNARGPGAASGFDLDAVERLAEDPSLVLIADLAGDLDWDSVTEAGLTARTGAVEQAVLEMSPDERLELQEILTLELSGRGRGAS